MPIKYKSGIVHVLSTTNATKSITLFGREGQQSLSKPLLISVGDFNHSSGKGMSLINYYKPSHYKNDTNSIEGVDSVPNKHNEMQINSSTSQLVCSDNPIELILNQLSINWVRENRQLGKFIVESYSKEVKFDKRIVIFVKNFSHQPSFPKVNEGGRRRQKATN